MRSHVTQDNGVAVYLKRHPYMPGCAGLPDIPSALYPFDTQAWVSRILSQKCDGLSDALPVFCSQIVIGLLELFSEQEFHASLRVQDA